MSEVKRIAEHTEKEEPDNLTHRKSILAGIEREGNVLSQTFALALQRIDLSSQTRPWHENTLRRRLQTTPNAFT